VQSPSQGGAKGSPLFERGEFDWESEIVLPSWSGYRSCGGAYGAQDSDVPSGGRVHVCAAPLDDGLPVGQEQLAACQYLLENDAAVHEAIVGAILEKYPEFFDIFSEDAEERGIRLPEQMTAEELKQHIGIAYIHLHPVEKDGVGYVGVEFGCSWDDEHGLGVMLHRTAVVDIGGADTSILAWIAERHRDGIPLDAPPAHEARQEARQEAEPAAQKRWWQFWK
jgi:hypothetical protein